MQLCFAQHNLAAFFTILIHIYNSTRLKVMMRQKSFNMVFHKHHIDGNQMLDKIRW